MPVGLVTTMEFYEKRDQLFVGGKEGCFIIDLRIKFKYDPSMAILLDAKGTSITLNIAEATKEEVKELQSEQKEQAALLDQYKIDKLPANYNPEKYGKHIRQLQGVGEWVKGFKTFKDQGLMVVWKKEIVTQNAVGP